MTKVAPIIELHPWLALPPGQALLEWEQCQIDRLVADVFGFHALQLGLPELDGLRTNRMPHRWMALDTAYQGWTPPPEKGEDPGAPLSLRCDFEALPFASNSLDLVVLPHALELARDPHHTLREVERVLVPEGRVVICGFNPASLWGLRQRRDQFCRRRGWGEPFLPVLPQQIGYRRLRDWLHLLDFEIEDGRFGCYLPAVRTEKWLHRLDGMDRLGARWWPIFGAVYFLVAVKRVHGVRLLGASWKTAASRATAAVPMANRSGDNHVVTMNGKSD